MNDAEYEWTLDHFKQGEEARGFYGNLCVLLTEIALIFMFFAAVTV